MALFRLINARGPCPTQSGQTLVELLVVIGLMAVMLPALATAMVASREGRAQEGERLQAAALLRETDEAVRSVREKGWTQFAVNGTYYPSVQANGWALTAGTETVGNFVRSVQISNVQRDVNGDIVASGGTVDSSTKKVTTTVSWTTPISSSISNETYYERYLNNSSWNQTSFADFDAGTKTNTVANSPGNHVELAAGGGASGPAYVQSASSFNDGAAATTIVQAFSGSVKGGNTIIVAISWEPGGSTVTCSDNQGNTYANATSTNDGTNNQSLAVCYASNVAGGATTVTATFNGSSSYRRIAVSEYSGLAATSPVDVTRTNIANGTTAPNNITSLAATTTTNGDLIFGAVMDDNAGPYGTITAGTGFTQRTVTNGQLAIQDLVQTTAGSIASTQTFSLAHRYLAHMVAFKRATTPATAWAPPNIVSSVDAAGTEDALDVYVSGNYAYVADATVLRRYDITNIESPTPTAPASYTAGGTINSFVVSGNYAYLATSNTAGEFVVVNVTTMVANVVNLPNTNIGTAIYVANNRAYIGRAVSTTNGQNEFYIYNVTTPTTPIAEGSLNLTAQVNSIVVPTATHAYLATSITSAEVSVVKIDVPATPTAAGTYDASGTSIGNDIFAVGNTIYLGKANNTSGGEFFILTANTTTPTAVTFTLNNGSPTVGMELGANVNGVYVSGTRAFLATALTNAQFRVVNVTSLAIPTVVGSLNLASTGNDVFFNGTYAFVASTHDTRELTIIREAPGTSGGGGYQALGTFESTTFDCITSGVCAASTSGAYNYITFTLTKPTDTNITFQIATNNDGTTWNFVGPDGTAGSSYSAPTAIRLNTSGRYIRYKATLTSNPGQTSTPILSDVSINYSP